MSIEDRLAKGREVAAASPQAQLGAALQKYRGQLEKSLPRHMSVDRFISIVNGAVSKNPDIASCEPRSILASVGTAARQGLEIDVAGHGFLVPYNDTKKGIKICQFIPGWQGIVDLINRSGRGVVTTGAVFSGDFFEWEMGTTQFVKHKNLGIETAENLIYTYAIGHIKGEGGWTPPPIIEVWPVAKTQHHLDTYNKVGKNHYALKNGQNWIMYARKIPLLQVAKYMPKSAEISKAIEAANRADSGEPMTIDAEFSFATDDAGTAGAGDTAGGSGAPPAGADDTMREPYAKLIERVKVAKSRDAVDLILDGARHLPADQYDELVKFADSKFPRT